mmetsp:Transcript_25001/g.57962  ORF Transcript_25001/g.57962 Transcript_25001/m.57962 type:complete len:203 (+) Transcript_25001:2209-2817(+)
MSSKMASTVRPFLPASLSVSLSILSRISLKSKYFRSGSLLPLNIPYSSDSVACILISQGHRVTIPLPRGRNERPTMFSRTDDCGRRWRWQPCLRWRRRWWCGSGQRSAVSVVVVVVAAMVLLVVVVVLVSILVAAAGGRVTAADVDEAARQSTAATVAAARGSDLARALRPDYGNHREVNGVLVYGIGSGRGCGMTVAAEVA